MRLAPLAEALREYILGHDVIHADETPLALLAPGRGKTKRTYMWVYRSTDFVAQRAVLFDFTASRGGEHPRRVLQNFCGTLVTDDFSGYHALAAQGVTAALCMAHARRKLFEAHKLNGSEIAGHAVMLIAKLYEIEREARALDPPAGCSCASSAPGRQQTHCMPGSPRSGSNSPRPTPRPTRSTTR